MIGPEVQKAIVDAVKASPAIAGGRIYDRVPADPTLPYLTLGNQQVIDDANSCDDGWEVFSDLHVWSQAVGAVEAKQLVAAIAPRLKAITTISGHTLISVSVESVNVFADPDGLTTHAVLTVQFLITPA